MSKTHAGQPWQKAEHDDYDEIAPSESV